jgi:hypothetical protein
LIGVVRAWALARCCEALGYCLQHYVRSVIASRSGDELLAAVDVEGGAGDGRVGHEVDREGGHVGRPDHAADRERGAELGPACFEVVAEQ